jgi:hypothetical protein
MLSWAEFRELLTVTSSESWLPYPKIKPPLLSQFYLDVRHLRPARVASSLVLSLESASRRLVSTRIQILFELAAPITCVSGTRSGKRVTYPHVFGHFIVYRNKTFERICQEPPFRLLHLKLWKIIWPRQLRMSHHLKWRSPLSLIFGWVRSLASFRSGNYPMFSFGDDS